MIPLAVKLAIGELEFFFRVMVDGGESRKKSSNRFC